MQALPSNRLDYHFQKQRAFIHLLLNPDQSPAQRNSTLFLSGTGVLLILLGIRLS